MLEIAKLYKDNLNRLKYDWNDFADKRLKVLKKNHFPEDEASSNL